LDAITITSRFEELRFDDQGVTVRNVFRTYRIGWAEVRRFTDGSVGGGTPEGGGGGQWALRVVLHNGRTVTAKATKAWTVAPSKTLVAIGQAAERYDIPADLTGTIERGSFPATLLGVSGTITVTIRDARLAGDSRGAILEVIQRTEPVQPNDILALSNGGTDVEVVGVRQISAGGRWEQVAYVYVA
jgi:Bacterial PH domain